MSYDGFGPVKIGMTLTQASRARLAGRQTCVVHGDPNPRNVRMPVNRVALLDWDEAHVDVPDLDLALPHNAAGLDDWDEEYAVKRLAEVRAV